MHYSTLTSLIVRLAGFALFVKIFDFFGTYFISVYASSTFLFYEEAMGVKVENAFDKLYMTGTFMAFTHLFLALFLIIKADWIANKLVKSEREINFDLTPQNLLKIIIATIGMIYCIRTLYLIPTQLDDLRLMVNHWEETDLRFNYIAQTLNYIIRGIIGLVFVLKAEQLSHFVLRKKGVKNAE